MFQYGGMRVCLGLLALAVTSAAAADCQASAYGAFVLRNPSNVTIHYQVKWGDGSWTSETIAPGHLKWHYYPLDEDGCVPSPSVRFDYIGGDGCVTYRTYDVDVYATYCPSQGKCYVFRYSDCGTYLDLYCD